MVILHKLIINNRYLRYTPFWWWYRLINHEGFRFDDYYVWGEFWHSINSGFMDMNYKWEFEKFWGKGAQAEKIVLSQEDFDALQKRLAEPPDPKVIERLTEILRKPAPWDD
jgi:hypothetical protein